MEPPVLDLRHVRKIYKGRVEALRGIALEVPKDWKTGPGVIIIEHWDKILDQAFKDPRALGQDPHPSENDTPEGKVEDEKNFTPPWCAICLGGPDLDHRACGR